MDFVVRNLSDQLVEYVRSEILSGAVPDNEPIRQDVLASRLGVSKIPLREALTKLEQEGLLRSQANRGFFVRALSAEEAEEVFELRHKLEPATVALAAVKASADEQAAARAAFEKVDEVTRLQADKVGEPNRRFHLALIRPAGKPLTTGILERLHVLSERYVRKRLESRQHVDRAADEHRAIIEAWLARDERKVAALTRNHISVTMRHLRRELTQ
jgi:DNA-binding GntR family transcriptional regulator